MKLAVIDDNGKIHECIDTECGPLGDIDKLDLYRTPDLMIIVDAVKATLDRVNCLDFIRKTGG